ncbi:anther-specific proline-rich protein APG-like [Manduca sexta]|nr:anther-specific proline-rich protein APG-like [Manduca sexta]
MPPPGLPFPFPPQTPDGAPMPPMPPLPPMPLPPSPQQLPMPMPMPLSMQQPRIPMVVMPYYSKNEKSPTKYMKKKRRVPKRHYEDSTSDSEASDSGSNDFDFRAKRRPRKGRRQVLTPVVSYVTKDGYVVYQKKIKKERAKDWLEIGKKKNLIGSHEESGELLEEVKHRLRRAKKRSRDD